MKTNYLSMYKNKAFLVLSVIFLSTLVIVSCSDDDDKIGSPYFEIEGDPTGLSVDMNESTSSYVVRSNRKWEVVPQEEGDWIDVSPMKGKGSGPLEFTVKANETFVSRVMNFVFVVDGEEHPVMFRVEQEPGVAFLEAPSSEKGLSVFSAGGKVQIEIISNTEWKYSIDENWLSESNKTDTQLELMAEANQGPERKAIVTFTSESIPSFSAEVEIIQSSGDVILEEDFNWLNYGNGKPYETKDVIRFDSWTQEEQDRGWSSTPNEFVKDEPLLYGLVGHVKLGKTNFGGDLVSPKLESINGTATIKITFKSMGYLTAGAGTKDDNILKVFAMNAGTIDGKSEFIIDNFPNNKEDDEAGVVNDAWAPEVATRSFIIKGATSETQIKFLGGDYDLRGVGQGKNRLFLDDIEVKIIQE